ncbi:hypothetical protein GLOTRDRAFT_118590 [Gloeophyllum trabeum ATCC 11539]|uniref:RRM domain-containing protein n=1 Tax=Gloeophyllum trabeum (strain ATCC 11539 / FP-39264 / Madison 617) TaxID=670483 RepID=S7QKF7_GLOTA|nr:uncharacterized protein GLOTRDRAFT_118590 [Gloeophyllum trabeum ATCC 11539]EPQ60246.1 hypothetical protein GLOTRDRAFT_118590 [Gloeophyllum trabeum ATCC 11539]
MDSYDTDTAIDHLFSSEHTTRDAVTRIHNWISSQAIEHPEAAIRDSVLDPDFDLEDADACPTYDPQLFSSPSCPNLSRASSFTRRKEAQVEWEQLMKSATPQYWVDRVISPKSSRGNMSRDKPLPDPPPFDADLADPFFPSSPAPTVSSFASASTSTTPPLSRAASHKSLRKPRLSRSISSSRFPSISTTLSGPPVDEEAPRTRDQSPALYAFPAVPDADLNTRLPQLPPTQPLRLPIRRKNSNHPNDSTVTLTGTPSTPTSSFFPSVSSSPHASLSTITTPALTDSGSPSSSTSSRAPRAIPSALSLFHLPSRSNLKSPSSPTSAVDERSQHRYPHHAFSASSSSYPSPCEVATPLSTTSTSRWSYASSEPDLTLASAPVSPSSSVFPSLNGTKQRIRNKSFHFPSLSLPPVLGGERKKKLVINGVPAGDSRATEAVRRWCESHGEVSRFQWKPDGLHVHFRKTSVADTVCRLQAQVEIKGAGSVSLSWYQGKRRP